MNIINTKSNNEPSTIEEDLVKNIFSLINQVHDEDDCELITENELYQLDSKDVEYEPYHEDMILNNESFSYQYMVNVINYVDTYPNHDFEKVVQKNFRRVKHRNYISRFRDYVDKFGTNNEKYKIISEYVYEKFCSARTNGNIIHDRTLRSWALLKSRELNLSDKNFKASPSWINNFKKQHRISSRKIVKFITTREQKDIEEIENESVELLLDYQDNIYPNYDPNQIFNTDQSGFNYLHFGNRTLSHTGERTTIVSVDQLNPLTHSYTIQPLIDMRGRLLSPLYVVLKENTNYQFGPIISNGMREYDNLYVTCSTSGKLDRNLVRDWKENVFKPVVDQKAVIYLDAWGGHKNEDLYRADNLDIKIKMFPKRSTSFMQPLDLSVFRSWKNIVKRFDEQDMITGSNTGMFRRNNITKMHSLIVTQFQHEEFYPMFRYGWKKAGFWNVPYVEYKDLKEILFTFQEDYCSTLYCEEIPFIKCAYCKKSPLF